MSLGLADHQDDRAVGREQPLLFDRQPCEFYSYYCSAALPMHAPVREQIRSVRCCYAFACGRSFSISEVLAFTMLVAMSSGLAKSMIPAGLLQEEFCTEDLLEVCLPIRRQLEDYPETS